MNSLAMDDKQRQLVQLIAAEVVKVMRDRSMIGTSTSSAAGSATPAPISPPIGICTAGEADAATPIALTGIVTASQLQSAMDTAADGVALLAPDARLSPLANDLARQHAKRVRRASTTDAVASASQADMAASAAWLCWSLGVCRVAEHVISQRRSRLTPMAMGRDAGALPQVMRHLAEAIKRRATPGGILFVPSAAKVLCYANRCPAIRAIVGTCAKAVEVGIDELGANVLVIEYAHHGPASMAAMVDRIMQQRPQVSPQVQRALSELQRCG
jgi:ribose 5-phosphate isomerase RpiB